MPAKVKIFILIVIFFSLLSWARSSTAATYTVCTSGCTATSFTSFFNSHSLGPDDILEARADTPGGSKAFSETLSPSAGTHGAAGHPVIIRARTGDHITIQGPGDTGYGSTCIYLTGGASNGYITFDGFTLTNFGYAGFRALGNSASDKIPGIVIQNCTAIIDWTATNQVDTQLCWFPGYMTNLTFRNNVCHIANRVNVNQTDCWQSWNSDHVTMDGNQCIDENQNGDGHNDCFQIERSQNGTSSDYTIKNNICVHASDSTGNDICTGSGTPISCCEGSKTGDCKGAKQLLYFEYECGGDNYIYNNLFYNVFGSGSKMIQTANAASGSNWGNFYFYNNSIAVGPSPSGFNQTVATFEKGTIVWKNNIIYYDDTNGAGYLMGFSGAAVDPANWRNNIYYTKSGSVSSAFNGNNWSGWKAAGYDNGTGAAASYFSNPKFSFTSSFPYDLTLQAGSPAIDAGADLSGIFTNDKNGTSRPQGSVWDIGAYEYSGGGSGDTTAPAAPIGLSVQ